MARPGSRIPRAVPGERLPLQRNQLARTAIHAPRGLKLVLCRPVNGIAEQQRVGGQQRKPFGRLRAETQDDDPLTVRFAGHQQRPLRAQPDRFQRAGGLEDGGLREGHAPVATP